METDYVCPRLGQVGCVSRKLRPTARRSVISGHTQKHYDLISVIQFTECPLASTSAGTTPLHAHRPLKISGASRMTISVSKYASATASPNETYGKLAKNSPDEPRSVSARTVCPLMSMVACRSVNESRPGSTSLLPYQSERHLEKCHLICWILQRDPLRQYSYHGKAKH